MNRAIIIHFKYKDQEREFTHDWTHRQRALSLYTHLVGDSSIQHFDISYQLTKFTEDE